MRHRCPISHGRRRGKKAEELVVGSWELGVKFTEREIGDGRSKPSFTLGQPDQM